MHQLLQLLAHSLEQMASALSQDRSFEVCISEYIRRAPLLLAQLTNSHTQPDYKCPEHPYRHHRHPLHLAYDWRQLSLWFVIAVIVTAVLLSNLHSIALYQRHSYWLHHLLLRSRFPRYRSRRLQGRMAGSQVFRPWLLSAANQRPASADLGPSWEHRHQHRLQHHRRPRYHWSHHCHRGWVAHRLIWRIGGHHLHYPFF